MTTSAPTDRARLRAGRRIKAAGGIGPDARRLGRPGFRAGTPPFPLDPCDVAPPHGEAVLPRRGPASVARLRVRARRGLR